MDVIKASGEKEEFNQSKFCDSLRRTDAPEDVVKEVCEKVREEIEPGITTSRIFRLATRHLMRKNVAAATKYNLKHGISQLGPAGFLFEQFLEVVLREMEYETKRNQMMQGECVEHEVDILAYKNKGHYIIEAKYHNETGIKTPLDVVMYADARHRDIARYQEKKEKERFSHTMWVITNTKFTTTAQAYAECRGISVTGWDYPKENSLQKMIETKMLYPVTTLPAVNRYAREQFARYDMMLVRDLVAYSVSDLVEKFGIYENSAKKIMMQAESLVYGEKKK